jgi:hypothetical protein
MTKHQSTTETNVNQKEKGHSFPWGTVVAIVIVILLGFYAATHPHSPISALLRVILSP